MKKLIQGWLGINAPTGPVQIGTNSTHINTAKEDFNVRIIKAANGYIVQGLKQDQFGHVNSDLIHIVGEGETLMDAVAKVVVLMQMG